ncbi:MAG: TetR/AcrR family transcriptional regulator [bacterium]|nr:TetR/AcrR family transcriptional regulator [bacterium]
MVDNEARRKANRQTRGLQRVEMILDAAASVFVEVGYADATMQMVAHRAKLSPGSLYQFFPNKGAVAEALATRYAGQLRAFYDQVLVSNLIDMPLSVIIDSLVDPLVEFNREHPAFYTLFIGAQVSPELAAILSNFHEAVVDNLATIFGRSITTLSQADSQRAALIMHRIFIALIPLILQSDAPEDALIHSDMKSMFVSYLSALKVTNAS